MADLLLVGLDDELAERIDRYLSRPGSSSSTRRLEVEQLEDQLSLSSDAAGAVVLGPEIADHARLLQRIHLRDPDLGVVALGSPERVTGIKRSLRYAPRISPWVTTRNTEDWDGVEKALQRTVDDTRHRRRIADQLSTISPRSRRSSVDPDAARQAEWYLRLVDRLPVGVIVADEAGIVLSWSRPTSNILGVDARDAVGQTVASLFPPSSRDQLRDYLVEATSDDGMPPPLRLRTEDRRLELTALGPAGSKSGGELLLMLQDRTEQHGLEEQLRQATLLASVGRLAGGVAHEFNNLLTIIRGATGLLEGEERPGNDNAEWIQAIMDATERAADLTDHLLAFGRRKPLHPEPQSPGAIVRSLEPLFLESLPDGVRLESDLEPTGAIEVDRARFEQVLTTLVLNACDAMPDGGVLTVRLGRVELKPSEALRFPGLEPGPHVALTITDTGEGMGEETRERLFEPFFTTREVGDGTGLELASVYGIVRQSGGAIEVESTPREGSAFTLLFPEGQPAGPPEREAPDRATAPSSVSKSPTSTETILVVEDDPRLRALVERAMKRLGYEVTTARDGPTALEIFDRAPDRIDIVLSDIRMPGMSGIEVADRIQSRRPELPVALMSGYSDEALSAPGSVEANRRFISKPFDLTELAETLQELLATPS